MQSVRSGFVLNFGLVSTPVDLYSVIPSKKKSSTKTLCEKHKVPIKQVYRCPVDEVLQPITIKGIEVTKGKFVILEEVEDIEADNEIDFVVVPTSGLETSTVTGEGFYYLSPIGNSKPWEVLYRVTKDKKRTLIGQTALRKNSRKIYKLVIFNDYLALQELIFPEHIRQAPEIEHPKLEKGLLAMAKKVADQMEIEWDKFDSIDDGLKRFQALIKGATPVVNEDQPADSGAEVIDLFAALEASLAGKA